MIKFTNNNHIKKCDCALGLLNINYCEVYKVNYASGKGYKKRILLLWYNKPEKTERSIKLQFASYIVSAGPYGKPN